MNQATRCRYLYIHAWTVAALVISHARVDAADRPNILFILADDLDYSDPRRSNPEAKNSTPNIDRLPHEGTICL